MIRHKRGDIREDGMVFIRYEKNCKNGEYWVTPEKFNELIEKEKKKNRAWYGKHRKKVIEKSRAWAKTNPERNKEQKRARYRKNPEKAKENFRAWREKNPEKKREINRAWREKNLEKANAKSARYRARKRFVDIFTAPYQKKIIESIYASARRISECLGIKHHVDHIFPLAKGGIHTPSNLQIIPAITNLKKGTKIPCTSY
jgi:hypothetical protein